MSIAVRVRVAWVCPLRELGKIVGTISVEVVIGTGHLAVEPCQFPRVRKIIAVIVCSFLLSRRQNLKRETLITSSKTYCPVGRGDLPPHVVRT
jgi:hypothetical protein